MSDSPPRRRPWLAVLRVLLAAGLLGYLIHRADPAALGAVVRSAVVHREWIAAGVLLTLAGLAMGALRWHLILRAQGLPLTLGRSSFFFFIGGFFNAFMLGACGGDVARAYLVAADAKKTRRAEAAATVFVDRALGLLAVMGFCCGMILYRLPVFDGPNDLRLTAELMLVLTVLSLAGLVLIFRRNLFETWGWLGRLDARSKTVHLARRVYEAFRLYRNRPGTLAAAVVLSIANLLFLAGACVCFGLSMGLEVPWADYLTWYPIITVLASIPLTPGGLGVREGLFVTLFRVSGVSGPPAVVLSLMVYAGSLVWSLFGGVLFLFQAAGAGRSWREELREMKESA